MNWLLRSRLAWRTVWRFYTWLRCDCRRVGAISSTGGRCDCCNRRTLPDLVIDITPDLSGLDRLRRLSTHTKTGEK